jgi:hypothetical protein
MTANAQSLHDDLCELSRAADFAAMYFRTAIDVLSERSPSSEDIMDAIAAAKDILRGVDLRNDSLSRLTPMFTAAHLELAKAGHPLQVKFLGRLFANWHVAAIDATSDALWDIPGVLATWHSDEWLNDSGEDESWNDGFTSDSELLKKIRLNQREIQKWALDKKQEIETASVSIAIELELAQAMLLFDKSIGDTSGAAFGGSMEREQNGNRRPEYLKIPGIDETDLRDLWNNLASKQDTGKTDRGIAREFNPAEGEKLLRQLITRRYRGTVSDWRPTVTTVTGR